MRGRLSTKAFTARALMRSGMLAPERPDRAARCMLAVARWGPTAAAGCIVSAIRHPEAVAIVDELGSLTFEELDRRTDGLALGLRALGVVENDVVALMCRNHRGFVETTIACSKLGAHVLLLNTGFAGPQVAQVCAREAPVAIVFDDEFGERVADAARDRLSVLAWCERPAPEQPTLESLIEAGGDGGELEPPAAPGRQVVLTSGTTGTPKGAIREQPETFDPVAGLLSLIALRARERTLIAVPLFHSWGLAHLVIGSGLSSTLVLRRRFDARETLRAIDEHGVTALVVAPVMLSRILDLGAKAIGHDDSGSLRVIASSGSALPGDLATRVMDAFGDVLYNLYGSTEVAWATIATPRDLREEPATAGRPVRGTVVRLYGDDDVELTEPGRSGRIFVGGEMVFNGYTGASARTTIDGLVSTGDVGHLDEQGRLYVDGREDEMIVSGAENIFPGEVEDAIARLRGVAEVAVTGVPDDEFGERLRAFVVARAGARLSAGDVREHVAATLARFKVPRDVVFLDELPRTATGKVLKRELGENGALASRPTRPSSL